MKLSVYLLFMVLSFITNGCLQCRNMKRMKDIPQSQYFGKIEMDDLVRTYRYYVPQVVMKRNKIPLVIALHGGGGDGRKLERSTLGKFNRLAEKDTFIVVYPDGFEKHWNDSRTRTKYSANNENINDVKFISYLIDELSKSYPIDKQRIYATGPSNGGMMSFRLGCSLSHRLAAIAPIIATMPVNQYKICKPQAPIAVLIMNGTQDPLVPYNGGNITLGKKQLGKVTSTVESVQFWVKHNQCNTTPVIRTLPDRDKTDNSTVEVNYYKRGKQNTEVILYKIIGGGHTIPETTQYLSKKIIGELNRDIDACQIIWEFFKHHKKKIDFNF